MTGVSRIVFGMSLLVVATSALVAADGADRITQLTAVQATYLERCAGCHGIQGHSAPAEVPSLRDQVGYFLCFPEARAYLVRLPSVANAPLEDDVLADLMNFVVFDIGGGRPANRAVNDRYSASEVRELRKRPLNDISLAGYREALVERLITECAAPSTLRQYSSVREQ